jgi:murein DD-endopeptidase MepM/ murein hydrolase activator NlpD
MKNRIVLLLGIPENVPLSPTHAVPMTLETAAGNHVILSLRNGHYAFYAHLQPGSIRIKPGDRVRRGQVLGLLGNSGNSNAPHLHFHISNGIHGLRQRECHFFSIRSRY